MQRASNDLELLAPTLNLFQYLVALYSGKNKSSHGPTTRCLLSRQSPVSFTTTVPRVSSIVTYLRYRVATTRFNNQFVCRQCYQILYRFYFDFGLSSRKKYFINTLLVCYKVWCGIRIITIKCPYGKVKEPYINYTMPQTYDRFFFSSNGTNKGRAPLYKYPLIVDD